MKDNQNPVRAIVAGTLIEVVEHTDSDKVTLLFGESIDEERTTLTREQAIALGVSLLRATGRADDL